MAFSEPSVRCSQYRSMCRYDSATTLYRYRNLPLQPVPVGVAAIVLSLPCTVISPCSQYRSVLPLSFVFGVSTCASAVHRQLPQHVSARLSLHKFHSQLATHYLAEMIDKVGRAIL